MEEQQLYSTDIPAIQQRVEAAGMKDFFASSLI